MLCFGADRRPGGRVIALDKRHSPGLIRASARFCCVGRRIIPRTAIWFVGPVGRQRGGSGFVAVWWGHCPPQAGVSPHPSPVETFCVLHKHTPLPWRGNEFYTILIREGELNVISTGEGYGETKCPHHLAATHRAQSQFLDLHRLIRQRVFIFFQAIGHFFWVSFMNPTEMGCNIFDVT